MILQSIERCSIRQMSCICFLSTPQLAESTADAIWERTSTPRRSGAPASHYFFPRNLRTTITATTISKAIRPNHSSGLIAGRPVSGAAG